MSLIAAAVTVALVLQEIRYRRRVSELQRTGEYLRIRNGELLNLLGYGDEAGSRARHPSSRRPQ